MKNLNEVQKIDLMLKLYKVNQLTLSGRRFDFFGRSSLDEFNSSEFRAPSNI